jgi:hypothetical protein
MKGRKKREITLYKNRTDGFYVFNTSTFTGFELSGNCFIHIYPFFENKRTSEIFIYDIQIVERNKSSVEMGIKKGASAYFAEFYVDNYHYTVVSRDNVLEINNHQELMNFHDIINNLRLRDYTYRDEGREDYNGFFLCGFVVRSYIDNSFILLKQEYLTRLPEI